MSSAAEVTTFTSGQMLDSARTLRSQPPHRAYAVVRILSTSACSSSLLFSYFIHTYPSALGRPIMSTRVGTSIGSLEVISAAGQMTMNWYRTFTARSRNWRVASGVESVVVKSFRIELRKSKYLPLVESSPGSLD